MTSPQVEDATYSIAVAEAARRAQLATRTQLLVDVRAAWKLLDPKRLADTFPGWVTAMSAIVNRWRDRSSAAAGAFYSVARQHATGEPTPADIIRHAAPPPARMLERTFGYAGPGRLTSPTAQPETALSTVMGTASRIALDGGRQTINSTVAFDPAAQGWYLHTDGDPCYFCALLASRGVVYKQHSLDISDSKFEGPGTAKVHNSCGCMVAPVFSGAQQLPAVNTAADEVYRSRDKRGDAVNAFRRAWEARQSK